MERGNQMVEKLSPKLTVSKLRKDGSQYLNQEITINGWVRTVRHQKSFSFVEVNDGSCLKGIQVLVSEHSGNASLEEIQTGTAVHVEGVCAESPGKGQAIEIQAKKVDLVGSCDATTYPLQKKRHSFEFLRTLAHLRPRTNTLGAVARIRHHLAIATHQFFADHGFYYLHSPIITGSDCEGAGELFRVTTQEDNNNPEEDFFGKPTFLTVSGQLNAEAYACALSKVYTFGPTFRAENSNTSRHLAEFWMIEPEIAFADLQDDIELAESYLKHLLKHVLTNCAEDLGLFNQFIEKGLIERLEAVVQTPFAVLSYTEAIHILEKAKAKFVFPVKWGIDLQSEHERYLSEQHVKGPVVITDYPKEIKAFYMRQNDDGKTVAAMDVLVPKIGEIIGGSQREERLDVLQARMKELNLPEEEHNWYLDLRRYGSVPHAGFGLGFERMVQMATGMENIRDVIPFPRYPGHANF